MSRKREEGKLLPVAAEANDSHPFAAIDTRAVSDIVSQYDEMSKRRLENMNLKLRELEQQMDSLETEMKKAATEASIFDMYPDHRIVFDSPPPPPSFVSP